MNDINTLKSGQSVIFGASKQIFTVKSTNTETDTVFLCTKGGGEAIETSIKNVFPITEHTKKVSKLIAKKQYLIKMETPFGVTINSKLIDSGFLNHWIRMCETENNVAEFSKAKTEFTTFVREFKQAIYHLENINVGGIPILEQI